MSMSYYNGFSPQERMKGFRLVKKAIAEGKIPEAKTLGCCLCGQKSGIIMYHSEDYSLDKIVGQVRPLCWTCHMMLHSRFRHPKSWTKYKAERKAGQVSPPVFRHDFSQLDKYFID